MSINIRDGNGWQHLAAHFGKSNVIELLLKHDPDAASKNIEIDFGADSPPPRLPLHLVCMNEDNEYLDAVKLLYDAYPEAMYAMEIGISHMIGVQHHLIMQQGRVRQVLSTFYKINSNILEIVIMIYNI